MAFVAALMSVALAQPRVYMTQLDLTPGGWGSMTAYDVDPASGAASPIAPITQWFNFAEVRDGISTYDEKRSIYYYATNFGSTLIYSFNTSTGALRPPLNLYSSVIKQLAFNQETGELIVLDKGPTPNATGVHTRMFVLSDQRIQPFDLGLLEVDRAIVDSVAKTCITYNVKENRVSVASLLTGAVQNTYKLDAACGDEITQLAFDKNHTLYAVSFRDRENLASSLGKLELSGSQGTCVGSKTFAVGGVMLCFYPKESKGELWYVLSKNGDTFLGPVDLETGKTAPVKTQIVPSEMVVAYP